MFSDDTVREYSSLVRKDRCVEDWYADTGTAFHMTDSLSCMKDVKPCHKKVKGIGGVTCEVALSGTLELVFVTADSEFSVELENCLLYTSPSPRDRQKSRMPSSA